MDPINIYDIIKADKQGLVNFPKATKSLIDDGGSKTVVTKEWVESKIAIITLALEAINDRIDNL